MSLITIKITKLYFYKKQDLIKSFQSKISVCRATSVHILFRILKKIVFNFYKL